MKLIVGNEYIDEDGDIVKVVYISESGKVVTEYSESLWTHDEDSLYVSFLKPVPKKYWTIVDSKNTCVSFIFENKEEAKRELGWHDEDYRVVQVEIKIIE